MYLFNKKFFLMKAFIFFFKYLILIIFINEDSSKIKFFDGKLLKISDYSCIVIN